MARPRLCDGMVKLTFRPGPVATELVWLASEAGQSRAAYIRGLVDKARMPDFGYSKARHKIVEYGRELAGLGKVVDVESGDVLDVESMTHRLDRMRVLTGKLLMIGAELPMPEAGRKGSDVDLPRMCRIDGMDRDLKIRMPDQMWGKLKLLGERSGASMAAVVRALIVGVALPDRDLLRTAAELGRTGWLAKHIAGGWRRVAGGVLEDKTRALYMDGRKLCGMALRIAAADAASGKRVEPLQEQ